MKVQLENVLRQQDSHFVNALNAMRTSNFEDEDYKRLIKDSTKRSKNENKSSEESVHLFPLNRQVKDHNAATVHREQRMGASLSLL